MRAILVGDVHCKVSNIAECQKLIDFIIKTCDSSGISKVVFLGDIEDSHSVIRGQVQIFWDMAFKKMSKDLQVIVIIGNHDMISQKNPSLGNSIEIFSGRAEGLTIVNEIAVIDNLVFVPYYHDREKFVLDVNSFHDKKTVICHQNFTQSLFGDMIDPDEIIAKNLIVGHIHSHHLSSGKVFYAGTPKWDSATDAGEEKGIWIFDFADDGDIISKEFISTRSIVTPIDKLFFNEGDEEPNLDPKARNYLEIKGQSAWINKMKKKYKGMANIKAVYTDRIVKSNKETSLDFTGFMSEFKPIDGVSSRDIEDYIKDLNEK